MRKLIVGALALLATTAAANATTITGTYSVTSSRNSTDIDRDLSSPFTLNLTLNTAQTFDLANITETGSDGHADLTAVFNFTVPGGGTATITGDDNFSTPGSSIHDAVTWDNSGLGVVNFADGAVLDITLHGDSYDGADWRYDGVDPTVSFDLVHAPTVGDPPATVPEPVTLSLFGAGLAGAVIVTRRRRKPNKA